MTRRQLRSLVVCCLFGLWPSTMTAEQKKGEISFNGSGRSSARVTLGKKLKMEATYQVIDVGGISAVSVRGTIRNNSSQKLHYAYFVAFHDKDNNLIGCQHFILFLDPGKQQFAGTFIQLPREQIDRITSYTVAFYESEQPIGKE